MVSLTTFTIYCDQSNTMAAATVEALVAYLLKAVPILIEGDTIPNGETLQEELESHRPLLSLFVQDSTQRALFVLHTPQPPALSGATHKPEKRREASQCLTLKTQLDLAEGPTHFTGVGFIKHGEPLSADRSMKSQLRVMSFTEGDPFEAIHSYIKDAVNPYFNSCVIAAKRAG